MPSRISCSSWASIVHVALGLEAGLVWAFVGGLALDVLAQRPLGCPRPLRSRSCVGRRIRLARSFARIRPLVADPATLRPQPLYSMTLFVAFNALRATIPVTDPAAPSLPGRGL